MGVVANSPFATGELAATPPAPRLQTRDEGGIADRDCKLKSGSHCIVVGGFAGIDRLRGARLRYEVEESVSMNPLHNTAMKMGAGRSEGLGARFPPPFQGSRGWGRTTRHIVNTFSFPERAKGTPRRPFSWRYYEPADSSKRDYPRFLFAP